MKIKALYILCIAILVYKTGFAQDNLIKNQHKVMGIQNPSFFGFGETTKAGVLYGSQGFGNANKIETKFAFANHFFENNNFSLAFDLRTTEINSLGYTISKANAHYIYRTRLSYRWTFNPSISVGYVNSNLNYNSLVFEDQINVLTGNIAAISIDPINVTNRINYVDFGAGFTIHNNENLFFGLNAKHLNTPKNSFTNVTETKIDLLYSAQVGYEFDINPYDQGILPTFSYVYLYNSFTKQGPKSRLDLYQELILGNVSVGFNQNFNQFEGFSISQFGTSFSLFVEQIEVGLNYSFEMSANKPVGDSFNSLEFFITFDFNPDSRNKRGNNSRFYGM
ncbi:PorP/SprF family type IX secretion system membrane protein [Polaribacter tangerinus]|uniref:PorP/SprF family type IX secretion system membrane protein n=1 Tax=Polaribacter tangerinus TaxID=1920034 RepID=UPI000B4C00E6|nr:PorP/SprF family type IX secretion system membrane protein [Polaribacter tangerinus]